MHWRRSGVIVLTQCPQRKCPTQRDPRPVRNAGMIARGTGGSGHDSDIGDSSGAGVRLAGGTLADSGTLIVGAS